MSLDCLNNIVGLSDTDCNCWDSSKPADFGTLNESLSGLYVSQPNTIPIRWTNGAADCENGGVWDLLIQARKDAVRDLVADFLAANSQVRKVQFLPFTKIGDPYYKRATLVRGNVAGAYIEPYDIRGGKIRVESVDLTFFSGVTAPLSVDISIYSSLDLNTPLATATANITANKVTATAVFPTPFIIDMGDIREDLDERFYFLYDIPTGVTPVYNDTERGCNCSRKTKYRDNPYLQVMQVGGAQTDAVSNVLVNTLSSGGMNGLVINASMECDYYSWLCELAQKPNELTSQGGQRLKLGMALADGIQAKAVANLAQSIINSGRINYYTMVLDVKPLYIAMNSYLKIYQKAIDNLVYFMPEDVTDCLVCATDKRMRKNQILR
jgi:hypothetical protein